MQFISKLGKNKMMILIISLGLLLALSFNTLYNYILFDFKYILLIVCLPVLSFVRSKQLSLRYGILSLLFLLMFPLLKISSLFFLGVACAALFIIESTWGKVSNNILLLLLIISPVSIFLSEIVGFEIRLQLSQLAAEIMNKMNPDIYAEGNIIYNKDAQFYVDQACAGLKMLSVSLISSILLMAYHEQKSKSIIQWYLKLIIIALTIATVILGNLCRIILLTMLQIGPETVLHYVVGVLCLLFYTLLPLYFIIIKSKTIKRHNRPIFISSKLKGVISVLILGLLIFIQIKDPKRSEKEPIANQEALSRYPFENKSVVMDNIIKVEEEDYLMYIKPALSFYSSDHSPMICWRGSGYKLSKEQTTTINGQKIFFGELNKGNDKLYSFWWYQCKNHSTTSQLNWRLYNLTQRDNVDLINVVSYSKELAQRQTKNMLSIAKIK